MYNSLPWEEDITRVYVLRPVGTSSSEGILLFPSKKKVTFGALWKHQGVGLCAFFACMGLYALWSRRKGEQNEILRQRHEGHTVNVKH